MTTPNEIITAASLNSLRTAVANTLAGKYGQPMSSAPVTQSAVAKLSDVQAVLGDLNKVALHQTGANNAIYDSLINKGVIRASEVDTALNNANDYLTTYRTYSNTRVGITGTQSTSSSTGTWTSSLTFTKTVTFASNADLNYFFNAGGQIRIVLAHGSTATTQDSAWGTLLTNIGTIIVGDNWSNRSGVLGAASTITGALNVNTTGTDIFSATNVGTGAYLNSSVTVNLKANAASPNALIFTITLIDSHTGLSDTIANATTASFYEQVPQYFSLAARTYS